MGGFYGTVLAFISFHPAGSSLSIFEPWLCRIHTNIPIYCLSDVPPVGYWKACKGAVLQLPEEMPAHSFTQDPAM